MKEMNLSENLKDLKKLFCHDLDELFEGDFSITILVILQNFRKLFSGNLSLQPLLDLFDSQVAAAYVRYNDEEMKAN